MPIPRCIYTYWHSDALPVDVQHCLSTIRTHNPEFKLVILSKKDIPEWNIKYDVDATHESLSDAVRLHVLTEHGGIWLDAHCICTAPLTTLFDLSVDQLQGFQTFDASIDSYAFACPKENPLVREWRDEFKKALNVGLLKYCKEIRKTFVLCKDLDENLPYLAVYACSIVAQDKCGWILKKNAKDPDGPLFYEDVAYYKDASDALLDKPSRIQLPPLIKLYTDARLNLQENDPSINFVNFIDKRIRKSIDA